MEWAHAMAPGASIMLVEASSDTNSDLLAGVQYAAAHANVVSMSWGGSEFSGETGYDSSYFVQAGVTFVASSGDAGAPAEWVAAAAAPAPTSRNRLPEGCGDADVVGASHPGRRL